MKKLTTSCSKIVFDIEANGLLRESKMQVWSDELQKKVEKIIQAVLSSKHVQ